MLYKLLISSILVMNIVNANSYMSSNDLLRENLMYNYKHTCSQDTLITNNCTTFHNKKLSNNIFKINSTNNFSPNIFSTSKNWTNGEMPYMKNNNNSCSSLNSTASTISNTLSKKSSETDHNLYFQEKNFNYSNNNEVPETKYVNPIPINNDLPLMNQTYYITYSNPITINSTSDKSNTNIKSVINNTNNKINNYNHEITECFSKYCKKLDINKAKQYLLKLYNNFDDLSDCQEDKNLTESYINDNNQDEILIGNRDKNSKKYNIRPRFITTNNNYKVSNTEKLNNNNATENKSPKDNIKCYKNEEQKPKDKIKNNNKTKELSAIQLNNRLYLLVDIALNFIKVNKELGLNQYITDDDINIISSLNEILYYENGLFAKSVLIKYFNNYKLYLRNLLHPLI